MPAEISSAMNATEETRVFGAKDKDQPKWQDTNLALFGSDIEYKIKEEAAKSEPQWTGAGVSIGLQVWRVEKFKVVPWPKSKYGEFHVGDSYIVLNTYKPKPDSPSLAWNVHFWIGSESTQDEYGTAAYKTVELDSFLKCKAVQFREVQGHESRKFLRYFGRHIKYLQGGVDSGFIHIEKNALGEARREATLLSVKGRGKNVALTEVPLKRSAMNSGDCFILDCNEGIYQWNGAGANGFEKSKAMEVCRAMRESRAKAEHIVFEEGSPRSLDPKLVFTKYLPVETADLGGESQGVRAADAEVADTAIQGYKKSIYQLSLSDDKRGEIGIVPLKSGKLPRELLHSEGVYVVDSGFQLYLWVGCAADFPYRISAFVFAQAYLKRFERPSILPLTRYAEGQESETFWWLFEKPVGYRIDTDPSKDPERFHPMMRQAPKAKKAMQAEFAPVHQTRYGSKGVLAAEPKAAPATEPISSAQAVSSVEAFGNLFGTAPDPAGTPLPGFDKPPPGDKEPIDEAADSDDEDEGLPPPDWRLIPWKDKLRTYDGTCFPVVSDAWGCCLTSIGCSWSDRVACWGMDVKGLYSPCVQIEAMCCKPSFDKAHPEVFCVLCQGYGYGVVPEAKLCKGSQQAFCVQNRCSLPCDDEVPSTCTCCGYQRCRQVRKTGDTLELVPFLPYPEVRIMDETAAMKRGGEADDFNLPGICKGAIDGIADLINTEQQYFANSCCFFNQSVGCDFPSCCGASIIGSCCICISVDFVMCKPVERHPRVECILLQGGAYVSEPKNGNLCGYTFCKGTGSLCCLEHRYSVPAEKVMETMPMRCTICGGQCCTVKEGLEQGGLAIECDRKCCVKIGRLPRVKPAVAEASDVVYHETRKALENQLLASKVGGTADAIVPQQQMQRL